MTDDPKQVCSNKGASGVDGMQTDELHDFMSTHWSTFKEELLSGTYQPKCSEKSGDTQTTRWNKNAWDTNSKRPTHPTRNITMDGRDIGTNFHENSYGFRPNKSAHQAVLQAQKYLNTGYTYVVEIDLAKFFDVVNHDKLMSLLSRKITDKRTLKLIGKYLRSGIMVDGVISQRLAGTPQGSPLSPLLSNIILHELDVELTKRGLRFVRYADDCSIYVKSSKAASRVMSSITKYIEEDLILQVNHEKSKISRPVKSTLLGFSFYKTKKAWRIRIAEKPLEKIKGTIRKRLSRNTAQQVETKMRELSGSNYWVGSILSNSRPEKLVYETR
ncbi:MAG: group II intron reverse transcriptase/maturase [Bacteroidetes bacterium]|nr:group II intron reverse transcriptase/maturase [Bacteroidota bacterium]